MTTTHHKHAMYHRGGEDYSVFWKLGVIAIGISLYSVFTLIFFLS